MTFVNVGVTMRDGTDIKTKKALKEAIAANPDDVVVYGTSDFNRFTGSAADLNKEYKYSVVGPNPYTSRKWYATLEKLANGTIKVS